MMTDKRSLAERLLNGDLAIPFYLSLLRLALHLTINAEGGYGLFRDEYYYIACAKELAAGYVDHPPMCAWLLRGVIVLFGDSLFSVRLLAALAGAGVVFVTGLTALRLGGGRLAAFIASALAFSPISLAMSGYYSMNSIDILLWAIVGYVLILIVQESKRRHWMVLGVLLGLGLLNKIGVLFLGAGIFAGLLLTSQRSHLKTPWPYVSGLIAFALFLPYVLWNLQHSLAHLEFIRNASSEKYSSLSVMSFLSGQVLINHPVAVFFWVPGLVALFFNAELRKYNILGWMFLVPLAILFMNGTSKAEYLAPAYAWIFAAGAVLWERLAWRRSAWKIALTTVLAAWIFVSLLLSPMVLPMLPVETYVAYADKLGFKPASPEGKEQSELPQFYADMFGWEEKARAVAEVYHSLSREEQERCAIFSDNYGRCASIDYFGEQYGLPKTIGGHNNYWIWGPRQYSGDIMIILGGSEDEHLPNFQQVKLATVVDCKYCMPYEDNVPVFVCRGLKGTLTEIWPDEKHFE